jgi:adenylate kinase
MLRAAVKEGTELGKQADGYMKAGQLVPDEVVIGMILERIAQPDAARGFVLDGFPRTLAQARALDALLEQRGQRLDGVLEFAAEDDALVDRISGRFACARCGAGYHDRFKRPKAEGVCDVCGSREFVRREDDKPKTVRARLKAYHAQTAPLLPYYRANGILAAVDGMAEIDDVSSAVSKTINALTG